MNPFAWSAIGQAGTAYTEAMRQLEDRKLRKKQQADENRRADEEIRLRQEAASRAIELLAMQKDAANLEADKDIRDDYQDAMTRAVVAQHTHDQPGVDVELARAAALYQGMSEASRRHVSALITKMTAIPRTPLETATETSALGKAAGVAVKPEYLNALIGRAGAPPPGFPAATQATGNVPAPLVSVGAFGATGTPPGLPSGLALSSVPPTSEVSSVPLSSEGPFQEPWSAQIAADKARSGHAADAIKRFTNVATEPGSPERMGLWRETNDTLIRLGERPLGPEWTTTDFRTPGQAGAQKIQATNAETAKERVKAYIDFNTKSLAFKDKQLNWQKAYQTALLGQGQQKIAQGAQRIGISGQLLALRKASQISTDAYRMASLGIRTAEERRAATNFLPQMQGLEATYTAAAAEATDPAAKMAMIEAATTYGEIGDALVAEMEKGPEQDMAELPTDAGRVISEINATLAGLMKGTPARGAKLKTLLSVEDEAARKLGVGIAQGKRIRFRGIDGTLEEFRNSMRRKGLTSTQILDKARRSGVRL